MAAIHKLSSRKVATAGPGKYEDGGGLRLVVSPTGSRKWVLRYTVGGRRREMGLGTPPDVTLAEARSKASEFRAMVHSGLDPLREKNREQTKIPRFRDCALEFVDIQKGGWKNAKHVSQWRNTLETYAFPIFGNLGVDAIDTEDVLAVLSPIWEHKTETAKRLQGRTENILDYAAAKNFRDQMNPARWRGHLDKLLPKPSRIQIIRHLPAMPFEEVPSFVSSLRQLKTNGALALAFLIVTATRTSEVLGARWSEMDLKSRCWIIPADRMKTRREHRVPLSELATELLSERTNYFEGNEHVFVGARQGRGLSNMTMLKVMRSMGYGVGCEKGDFVPHGFRSSFRDWAGEVSSYPGDVIEMALAHTIRNKVEAAYRRGDLFEKRRALMDSWAIFLEGDLLS